MVIGTQDCLLAGLHSYYSVQLPKLPLPMMKDADRLDTWPFGKPVWSGNTYVQ